MKHKIEFIKEQEILKLEIIVQSPIEDSIHKNWSCNFFITGIVHQDILGANAIQAINLTMQQIKHRLVMLLDDGYTICYLNDDDKVEKVYT